MQDDLEQLIRARANEIWEREGRPEGCAEAHWSEASAEVTAETAPAPRKARTPSKVAAAATKAPAKRRSVAVKTDAKA